ncbi:hypothetical protein VTL71DRAFT_15007 [Oculimacula yallundae]|uniref:NADH dehydrogenase subunit 1 n=1 Tax=Oculimacula yallundae TaxID=86028 RepID=A0ABR4CG19_9HELO
MTLPEAIFILLRNSAFIILLLGSFE